MVIADSDVWIDYLNGITSVDSDALAALLEADDVNLTGIVLAELTRGARSDKERQRLNDIFAGIPYLESERHVWERAGRLAQTLDAKGQPLALPDVLLAAIAIENNHELLTRDKHFSRIPGLRLYAIKKGGARA